MFDVFKLFITFIILELPYALLMILGLLLKSHHKENLNEHCLFPTICVGLTCYSEGDLIELAIESLAHQNYEGKVIVMVLVDGGSKYNLKTVDAGKKMQIKYPNLDVRIIDKDDRYGRVDSNNMALQFCLENEIDYLMILDGDTSISKNTLSSFMQKSLNEPLLSAISGNIKVRNLKHVTPRLSYIEYATGLILSRFSFSFFGYTNNVSGAFGFFKVKDIAEIGGWRPNTAEDYDLTLRCFIHKLKVGHCDNAYSYTDSPDTLAALLKQRWTWSGDLIFLFNMYHKYLTIKNLGIKIWFFVWFNALLLICIPVCIIIYSIAMLMILNFAQILFLSLLVYILYFYMSTFMFLLYYFTCEDEEEVGRYIFFYLILFPFYTLILRINDFIAYGNEIFFQQHLYSKMAPAGVLLKAHYEKDTDYIKI